MICVSFPIIPKISNRGLDWRGMLKSIGHTYDGIIVLRGWCEELSKWDNGGISINNNLNISRHSAYCLQFYYIIWDLTYIKMNVVYCHSFDHLEIDYFTFLNLLLAKLIKLVVESKTKSHLNYLRLLDRIAIEVSDISVLFLTDMLHITSFVNYFKNAFFDNIVLWNILHSRQINFIDYFLLWIVSLFLFVYYHIHKTRCKWISWRWTYICRCFSLLTFFGLIISEFSFLFFFLLLALFLLFNRTLSWLFDAWFGLLTFLANHLFQYISTLWRS